MVKMLQVVVVCCCLLSGVWCCLLCGLLVCCLLFVDCNSLVVVWRSLVVVCCLSE